MSYRVIPIFIPHAGCPNDCVFCNQKRIAGTICAPKPEEVSALLSDAFRKTQDAEIAFYGGSFTALDLSVQEEYLRVASGFNPNSIRLSTRPDAIDDTVLKLLKKYSVKTIELGAQSMDDAVLSASSRGHDAECVRCATEKIKKAGFNLVLQMMVGLPGEDEKSALDTARKIADLSPDAVRVYPTVVVRDTELETLWRNGEYTALTVSRAVEICAEITKVFKKKNIPIIRMGLNPTEDLNGGDALAGAYHPAFGQLVSSRLRLFQLEEKLSELRADNITIYANPRAVSEIAGHKGENKKILAEKFALKKISIVADEKVQYDEIIVCEKKV